MIDSHTEVESAQMLAASLWICLQMNLDEIGSHMNDSGSLTMLRKHGQIEQHDCCHLGALWRNSCQHRQEREKSCNSER